MLDTAINQATGLQGLAAHATPRLMAVASHGQQQGDLPVLWGLCDSLTEQGLSVVVLDGHACESYENPGLNQLLDDPTGRIGDDTGASSWAVVPARTGFERLHACGLSADNVGCLLQNYSVVLIYADATTLAQLVKDTGLSPLLVVTPQKSSTLTAYKALKQLLLDAHLRPTVANIAIDSNAATSMPSLTPFQYLQDCAETFLGYSFRPITITATSRAGESRTDINRLALQLLENAIVLERHVIKRMH